MVSDPTVHLSLQDFNIDSHTARMLMRSNVKQSKTVLFCKSIQVFLGKTGHSVCQTKEIMPYLSLRGNKLEPLFTTHNNSPLIRKFFSISLSAFLSWAGLDHQTYNTHSFRVGAAISARLASVPKLDIKLPKWCWSNAW